MVTYVYTRRQEPSPFSFAGALKRRPQSDMTKAVFYWDGFDYSKLELNPVCLQGRISPMAPIECWLTSARARTSSLPRPTGR